MNKLFTLFTALLIAGGLFAQQAIPASQAAELKALQLTPEAQAQLKAMKANHSGSSAQSAQAVQSFYCDYEAWDFISDDVTQTFIWRVHNSFAANDYIYLDDGYGNIDSTQTKFKSATVATSWLNDSYNEYDSITIPHETATVTIDSIFYIYGHQNVSGETNTIRTRVVALNSNGYPSFSNVLWEDILETDTSLTDAGFVALRSLPVGLTLNEGQRFGIYVDCIGGDRINDEFYVSASYNELCGYQAAAVNSVFWPNSYYDLAFPGLAQVWPTSGGGDIGFDFDGDNVIGENEECENFYIQNWSIWSYITVDAPIFANVTASVDTICVGDPVQLFAEAGLGTEPYQYEWTGNGNITSPNSSSTYVVPTETTTYTCTVSDADDEVVTQEYTIYVDDLAVDFGGALEVECGEELQVIPTVTNSLGGDLSYSWSTGATTLIQELPAGDYSLTVSNSRCSITEDVIISNIGVSINAGFSYTVLYEGEVQFTNESSGASSYIWGFGDGTTSILDNPTHTFGAPGNYTVTLIAEEGDCSVTTTQDITVTIVPTSIKEHELIGRIDITPNPAKDWIDINIDGIEKEEIMVEVLNLRGQSLITTNYSNGLVRDRIDVSEFAEGIYMVAISSQGETTFKKLVVSK